MLSIFNSELFSRLIRMNGSIINLDDKLKIFWKEREREIERERERERGFSCYYWISADPGRECIDF